MSLLPPSLFCNQASHKNKTTEKCNHSTQFFCCCVVSFLLACVLVFKLTDEASNFEGNYFKVFVMHRHSCRKHVTHMAKKLVSSMRNLAGKPGFSNHLPQLQAPGLPLHDIQEISLLDKVDCNLVEFMAWLR